MWLRKISILLQPLFDWCRNIGGGTLSNALPPLLIITRVCGLMRLFPLAYEFVPTVTFSLNLGEFLGDFARFSLYSQPVWYCLGITVWYQFSEKTVQKKLIILFR